MKSVILSFLFLTIFLSSCTRGIKCTAGGVNLVIGSKKETFPDSIYVIKYEKESAFSIIEDIDSFYFDGKELFIDSQFYGNDGYLMNHSDYKIVSSNRTYEISGFFVPERTMTCGGLMLPPCDTCFSFVDSLYVNDSIVRLDYDGTLYLDY